MLHLPSSGLLILDHTNGDIRASYESAGVVAEFLHDLEMVQDLINVQRHIMLMNQVTGNLTA